MSGQVIDEDGNYWHVDWETGEPVAYEPYYRYYDAAGCQGNEYIQAYTPRQAIEIAGRYYVRGDQLISQVGLCPVSQLNTSDECYEQACSDYIIEEHMLRVSLLTRIGQPPDVHYVPPIHYELITE